ncbi:MAG: VanZ family protein [bacterium]
MSAPSNCNTVGFRLMLGVAVLLTTILAITPQPEMIVEDFNDKLGHIIAFVLLAFLTDGAWPGKQLYWQKGLGLFGYGVLLECLQYFVPTRFFSLLDMVANGTGIMLYGLVAILIGYLRTDNTHLQH